MSRTEHDLRAALRQLEQRADEHGAPTAAALLDAAGNSDSRPAGWRSGRARWLPPIAVAVVVLALITTVTVVTLNGGSDHAAKPGAPTHSPSTGVTDRPSTAPTRPSRAATTHRAPSQSTVAAVAILNTAAAKLDATSWTAPAPNAFYYRRTTAATTWTSVSGRQEGDGRNYEGVKIWIPGCKHGRIVSGGEAGACTLDDVPHYRADAPTTPSAWDRYLERIAPGAKAAHAQGKIITGVLEGDLIAPKAAAALLRYTATCPGLHTLAVRPAHGRQLIGVTCTSMTNGSYGLAFDKATHAMVGFVVVDAATGKQDFPAEIVLKTAIVAAIGRTS